MEKHLITLHPIDYMIETVFKANDEDIERHDQLISGHKINIIKPN